MPEEAAPPRMVRKRDGSLAPFDADKISRALFAAAEGLGRPDPFLVRELTDGVVHFLAAESDGETPTTEQVGEVVVKVVRELGRPDLAEAFAAHGRRRVRRTAAPAAPPAAPAELTLRLAAATPPGQAARPRLAHY